MKKHFILTSLVAIAMSCPAMAAATDVTFSGKYNGGMDVSAGVSDTTYDYVRSNGTTATGIAYNSDPVLTDFTYKDVDGSTKSLQDGTPPDISTYTGTTTASGDIVTTQTIAAGATASRDNYTYVNGAGEVVTLGENAQDMVEVVALDATYTGGASVDVVNGTAGEFNGTLYTVEDSGYVYHLSEDGTKLVDDRNLDVTPTAGSALETEFNNMVAAYNADKANIVTAEGTTAANKVTEDANFAAADVVFRADSDKIDELDGYFETVGAATEALEAARAAQKVAAEAYVTNGDLYQAAKNVYDAPILETITNGAKAEIDNALADNGAIDVALDAMRDEADEIFAEKQQWVDNTLGIESVNSSAVSDALTGEIAGDETTFSGAINAIDGAVSKNTTDIATNAENIAVNKAAIEEEVARATAAEAELDGKIALNTTAIEEEVANRIAGDDMTLASAKAYVDSKNELALKSAYDYTDKKVDALEEDLSAGIASAAAMSSVAVSGVGKGEVSVGAGYGNYNSQSAVAFGAAMGLSDNWSVNAAAGLADSNVTFRAGTNYKFKLF